MARDPQLLASPMRAPSPSHVVPFAFAAFALLAFACGKRTEADARATDHAERVAAESDSVSSAELTGAAIDVETVEAREDALREQADAIAAVRREQLAYRSRIRAALDRVERELAARPSASARERRKMLANDLSALDRSTGQEWATIRARLDRDLAHAAEPPHPERAR
jgi:hypothetical protein